MFPSRPAAACAVALLATACGSAAIYYPEPVPPLDGWDGACSATVEATVVVENNLPGAVEVSELLPEDRCPPSFRGTVAAGETADLGAAVGSVWRVYDAETTELVATFDLSDGENVLVLP